MGFSSQRNSMVGNQITFNFGLYALSLLCFLPNRRVSALSTRPPFQLQRIDHIVLTVPDDVQPMMKFYTEILGCTIDSPDDIGRMNGRLTHLRAGLNTMIDLIKREDDPGSDTGSANEDQTSSSSAVDHFCLRIDPYDQDELEDYLEREGIEIQSSGMRKGAEGVGPSIYINDPEGNTIELKGPAVTKQTSDAAQRQKGKEGTIFEPPEPSTAEKSGDGSNKQEVPVTPCTRICRYNADFFGGQVCIGCYREPYEIGTWASMSPSEKYMGLLDAIDRCDESAVALDGAISVEELQRQADYWKQVASEAR